MTWNKLLGTDCEPEMQGRSHYERDYDKIVFSQPFRLLQNKTQVLPLPVDDFVHSRLTHSLEVSSVGRTLGHLVGQKLLEQGKESWGRDDLPDQLAEVVRVACLAHDIGNPPFGHAGELAIRESFLELFASYRPWSPGGQGGSAQAIPPPYSDFTNFEGNAQGFRLINGNGFFAAGKLSLLSRLAFSKYTRSAEKPCYFTADSAARCDQAKVGFYHSEQEAFGEIAAASGLLPLAVGGRAFVRHPLAWLVEAADDICYRLLDVEDGINLSYIGSQEGRVLLAKIAQLSDADQPLSLLRSRAIKRLIESVVKAFLEQSETMLQGQLTLPLFALMPQELQEILAEVEQLSQMRLYRHPKVLASLIVGCRLLKRLLANFVEAMCTHREGGDAKRVRQLLLSLSGMSRQSWHQFDGEAEPHQRLRYVVDFVANLSDRGVLSLMRKLEGSTLFEGSALF